MHVREGYITCLVCVCVCALCVVSVSGVIFLIFNPRYACMHQMVTLLVVCVCVSATTPAAISLVFTRKMRYVWLHYKLFKVLDSKAFSSKVMA